MNNTSYFRSLLQIFIYLFLLSKSGAFKVNSKNDHRSTSCRSLKNIQKSSIKKYTEPISTRLSRSLPLQTAGSLISGFIPRLEPGLRIRRYLLTALDDDNGPISTISIDLMGKVNSIIKNDKKEHIGINSLVNVLFASAKGMSTKLVDYMRRVVATSVIVAAAFQRSTAAAAPPVHMRRIAAGLGVTFSAIVAGPKLIARAAVLSLYGTKRYQSLTATQKLATTPLYFISNSRGNAFLQEDIQAGKPEQKIVVYFMSSEDAADYLDEMAQINALNANEFRMSTTSMEKIIDQIVAKKQSRKLGRYPIDLVYRIQPSSRQCDNAEVVAGNGDRKRGVKAVEGMSIPVFTAQGLVIRRPSGETVSPYYFALEDLYDDWAKTDQADKKPKVLVRDFTEVMCLASGISQKSLEGKDVASILGDLAIKEALSSNENDQGKLSAAQIRQAVGNPGFVPPREEIEMLKNFYRHKVGLPGEFSKAKLMQPMQ